VGFGFFTGKFSIALVIGTVLGVAVLFGAPKIVGALTGNVAISCGEISSDIYSSYLNSGATESFIVPATGSQSFASWSNSANTTTLSTLSSSPSYVANGIGSYPALLFSGSACLTASSNKDKYKNNFTLVVFAKPTQTTTVHAQSASGVAGAYNVSYLITPEWGTRWNSGANYYNGVGISVGTNVVEVAEHSGGYLPIVLSLTIPTADQSKYNQGMIITLRYNNKNPSLKITDIYGGNVITKSATYTRADNQNFYLSYDINCSTYGRYSGYVGNIYYY